MNPSRFRTAFPRQLRFWAFHCTLSALPSLGIIALILPELRRSPNAIAAMLSAIATFILSFLLLMISFFAVIFLQARDRKRVFAVAEPR